MKEKRKKVIVYAEDLESIPEQSENFFRNADIIIIDAAIYNLEREDGKLTATKRGIRGHLNTSSALQIIKKYKPDLAFLTQLGHTYPDYEETVNNVRHAAFAASAKRPKQYSALPKFKSLETNVNT